MRLSFSNEYIRLRYDLCNKKLARLPKVSRGHHDGVPVIRIKQFSENGKRKVKELKLNNKRIQEACELESLRNSLSQEIDSLKHTEVLVQNSSLKLKRMNNVLNGSFYNGLNCGLNTQPIKGDYYHNGIHMRSRAELIVAEVLDELKLQYKYEPAIEINGTYYYPDFIVYIEEINCCIIIEVLGMTDNYEYLTNSIFKISKYSELGIHINKNLLLIAGSASYFPDTEDIYNSIVTMVNLAVLRALI